MQLAVGMTLAMGTGMFGDQAVRDQAVKQCWDSGMDTRRVAWPQSWAFANEKLKNSLVRMCVSGQGRPCLDDGVNWGDIS